MRRLLQRLFGKKYYIAGMTGAPFDQGLPVKLHGGEGYFRHGDHLYYWKEVE